MDDDRTLEELVDEVNRNLAPGGGGPKEEELLDYYKAEVAGVKPLLPGEEERLLRAIADMEPGAGEAAKRLCETRLPLAIAVASRYRGKGLPMGDLIQEANVALFLAASSYGGGDFDLGAEQMMQEALEAALLVQNREKTVAEDMRARVNVLKDVSAAMAKELDREPTVEELAERMRMTEDEIRDIMKVTLDAMSVSSGE